MNYVQYSPWQDAATVGKGIGDALGAILFTLPQMRRQMALDEKKLQLEEKRVEAQAKADELHGEYWKAQSALMPSKLELDKDKARVKDTLDMLNYQLNKVKFEETQKVNAAKIDEGLARIASMAQNEGLRRDRFILDQQRLAQQQQFGQARLGISLENAITQRGAANAVNELYGMNPLEGISRSQLMPPLMPLQQQVTPTLSGPTQPGNFGRGFLLTDSPLAQPRSKVTANQPPDSKHRVLIRKREDGSLYWTTPKEAQGMSVDEWEILRQD